MATPKPVSSVINLNPGVIPITNTHVFLAIQAIKAKAAQLGPGFTGPSTSAVEAITLGGISGYMQMYAQCTIYYSEQTGAHEVHGDILRKFVVLPMKGMDLGFPVTDETGTPDGQGRYNHFSSDASIYWHPNTGPMALQGPVRDRWASQGWERGPLGYPVRDVFTPEAGETAGDFQNGVIWIGPNGYADALVASMPPAALLDLIWHQFDTMVHQSPDNIGLHPEKSFDGVTDTGYGFDHSWNRGFKVTINGFKDNGLVLPDIDWSAHMAVVISLGYGLGTDSQNQTVEIYTIGAQLLDIQVTNSGVLTNVTNDVATGVANALQSASDQGINFGQSIPIDVPLLSLKMMLDGSLAFILSPTVAGSLARNEIQQRIDNPGT
jgi:hypothetical protein